MGKYKKFFGGLLEGTAEVLVAVGEAQLEAERQAYERGRRAEQRRARPYAVHVCLRTRVDVSSISSALRRERTDFGRLSVLQAWERRLPDVYSITCRDADRLAKKFDSRYMRQSALRLLSERISDPHNVHSIRCVDRPHWYI